MYFRSVRIVATAYAIGFAIGKVIGRMLTIGQVR